MSYPFVKGHGTENDFVIVPGDVELTAARAAALCDRRAGIGGDGVIRAARQDGRWFMDYRNADGSLSEMCGNGIRVLGRYLVEVEGVETGPIEIDTRAGLKTLTFDGDRITVDMGVPEVLGETVVSVGDRSWAALHVSMGNPHAVAWVDDLADAGPLCDPPGHDAAEFPEGVNVEFVRRVGERHVAMRVHERGSGETRSCGTGACAVMVTAALADGAPRGTAYTVDVPGGRLEITWTDDDRVLLTGPAVLVAQGTTSL
ncbi:MAG TPA: diaminopimelate epimerase [Nocardioides sp.]|nr:diaminopimelate epimerase [Nocardioides sp.]